MKTKYNVNDIVYWVNDYKIVKAKIKEVIIKKDKTGTTKLYNIVSVLDKKERMALEAQLVENLTIAKRSATINWAHITKNVTEQIENMTEKTFEPLVEIKNDK